MKKSVLVTWLLALTALSMNAQPSDFPKLTGPYLGQTPPGRVPEIFAPGAVSSKDHIEMGCTWSPDLKEFYFARSETSELSSNWAIWCLREENGVWSEPQVVSFSGVYRDFGPFIPPDGKCMIFIRRDNKENKTRMGSWIVDRKGSTWSEPRFFHEAYCLTTNDFRTFYFSTEGSERDIGRMGFDNGVFSTPVKVPSALNTPEFEAHACLSPDGSYMLFDRTKSTFVSFLREDGTWSRGYDLGRKYNIPAISPDGKYIFFESDGDIYWVEAKIVEKFRIQGAQKDDFPAFTGPYLGQKPPGLAPEVFAPGIVSTVHHEHSRIDFSQDGMEIYWAVIPVDKNFRTRMGRPFRMDLQSIRLLKNSSGGWSSPQVLQIIKNKDARSPVLSPDEKFLYFFSSDPNVDPMMNSKSILYRASRKDGVWAEPVRVSGLIPEEAGKGTMSFCFAKNGNVYFDYGQADATSEYVWHIYFSEYQNGAYRAPLKLEYGINDGKSDWCPWIAPDESYLIWSSHREGEAGNGDLYISFRQANGTWGRPVNMGIEVNTSGQERFPSVSPDGKYLFFARHKDRITYSDIYWMSASVIETLREKVSSTEKRDQAGVAYSWSKPNDFPQLTGPYLGQKPPGMTPEIFASGILSRFSMLHGKIVFSPDGLEAFWTCNAAPVQSRWTARQTSQGIWAAPEPSFFSIEYVENSMAYSPDGKRLYFHSRRPLQGTGAPKDKDIWFREKTSDGWGDPVPLGPPVNHPTTDESAPSLAADGTLFFTRQAATGAHGAPGHGAGQIDIFYSEWRNGTYTEPVRLGPEINSEYPELDPVIAPDRSCLLFTSARPDGYSRMMNLYVSFRTADGRWTPTQCLSHTLKIDNIWFPSLSTDGAYLFFCGGYPTDKGYTDSRYYWVDASFIEELRPKEVRKGAPR